MSVNTCRTDSEQKYYSYRVNIVMNGDSFTLSVLLKDTKPAVKKKTASW